MQLEAWRRPGRQPCHVQRHPALYATRVIAEHDLRPVHHARGAIAQTGHVGHHRLRQAEQAQRLVDHMRAQVEPQARTRPGPLAPAVARHRRKAVEAGNALAHIAQRAAPQGRLCAEKVTIPAPVVEHGQQAPADLRQLHQVACLVHRDGEGLVDHHMLAGQQRGAGERVMAVVGAGDDDEVDRRVGGGGQVVGGDPGVRPAGVDLAGIAGGDQRERQALDAVDQRGMEGLADIAEPDQSDVQHGRDGSFRYKKVSILSSVWLA